MNGIRREGNLFRQSLTIPCYHTDARSRLKPAAFLDLAQELAYWAAQALGFGYDSLREQHTAWVLSRLHFHVHRPPRWREQVELQTWHKGSDGLFFLRDFRMMDASGAELISCTSSWLVLDVGTRRMVRPEAFLERLQVEAGSVPEALPGTAPKLFMPRDSAAEPAGEHTVAYSDIDVLGHANNARYLVWAMDSLPAGRFAAGAVRDVYLNFNRETLPGETVSLERICTEAACHVEGKVAGRSAFLAKLVF